MERTPRDPSLRSTWATSPSGSRVEWQWAWGGFGELLGFFLKAISRVFWVC